MKSKTQLSALTMCALAGVSLFATSCSKKQEPAGPQVKTAATAGLLPLPSFEACSSTAHPMLPEKWVATAVLQDFALNQLAFGKFVYDESAKAFRFTLADQYGTYQDHLVTESGTLYQLMGGGEIPTACRLETTSSPWTMPTRDWLDAGAECVGRAPILKQNQDWWKTPKGPGANWIWFNSDTKLPFRSMYYELTQENRPIYEYFTFNYFPTFEAVPDTNLSEIVAFCEANCGAPAASRSWARRVDPNELFAASSYPKVNANWVSTVQQWIPEISPCSSLGALPPPWPEKLQASVIMTAVSFPPNPFPTRVFYDWSVKAQNSSLYYNPPTPDAYVQIALLTGNTGYIRVEDKNGKITGPGPDGCLQVLPGPQVRNWKEVDGCQCRAQIAPHSILNPTDVPTKILWCPTDLSAQQVFWTWYSDTGTPVVFMQSNSSPTDGTGLNLADYYEWLPGSQAPPGTFDIPANCMGKPKTDVPQACHNCHLPNN